MQAHSLTAMIDTFTPEELQIHVPPHTKSLCVMASYSDTPNVSENLCEYLRQLSPHFERILMITNARPIVNQHVLPTNCGIVIVPNEGRDFGMWHRVLYQLPQNSIERLALVNDSCYIINDLANSFERAKRNKYGFWGMVYSEETSPHIQSYFMVAETHNATADLLGFFKEHPMRADLSRDQVIEEYEIGLSTYMLSKGYTLHGLYSMTDVLRITAPRAAPPNPSIFYWEILMIRGAPLLKRKGYWSIPAIEGLVDEYFLSTIRPHT